MEFAFIVCMVGLVIMLLLVWGGSKSRVSRRPSRGRRRPPAGTGTAEWFDNAPHHRARYDLHHGMFSGPSTLPHHGFDNGGTYAGAGVDSGGYDGGYDGGGIDSGGYDGGYDGGGIDSGGYDGGYDGSGIDSGGFGGDGGGDGGH